MVLAPALRQAPAADPCDCPDWSHLPRPLGGLIPFNDPGAALVLWDGDVAARDDVGELVRVPGRVTLAWRRGARLEWAVDEDELSPQLWRDWHGAFRRSKSFFIDFGGELCELDADLGHEHGGRLNGASLGQRAATLDHVITHWVGFPNLFGGRQIHAHAGEGWRTWGGRHEITTHGWNLTIDARPDLREVLTAAKDAEVCVLTHVMELRRADGNTFTPTDVKHLLWGLQAAVSFARGYWSCPAVPVGFDAAGDAVWGEWRPLFADPPREGLGWWDEHRMPDLIEFIDKYLALWLEDGKQKSLQFATINALSAVETGFVEQRLTTAVTGLELLSWVIDVQERGVNPERWEGKPAYKRLRKLLVEARIPLGIEVDRMPTLAGFAQDQGYKDGADAVIQIRHRLTHPKDNSDLYAAGKALAEASRLALRFLELVLLHRIGYTGQTYDRTHTGKWSGESQPVPWT